MGWGVQGKHNSTNDSYKMLKEKKGYKMIDFLCGIEIKG